MKLFAVPPVIYELFWIKNVAWTQVNPATEETSQAIAGKQIGNSFWLQNVLGTIKKFTWDAAGQLRITGSVTASIANNQDIRTVAQANVSMWDMNKQATGIAFTNSNFQSGGRRLIRKV